MIDSYCDYCGTYKEDCSHFKGCMVCKECQEWVLGGDTLDNTKD